LNPPPPFFRFVFGSKTKSKNKHCSYHYFSHYKEAKKNNFYQFFDIFSLHTLPIREDSAKKFFWGFNHLNVFPLTHFSYNPFYANLQEDLDDNVCLETFSIMDHFHIHKGFSLVPSNFQKFCNSTNREKHAFFEDFKMKSMIYPNPYVPKILPKFYPPKLTSKDVTIRFYKPRWDPSFLNDHISYYQWSFIYYNHSTELNFSFALFCRTDLSLLNFFLKSLFDNNFDLVRYFLKFLFLSQFSFPISDFSGLGEAFRFSEEFQIISTLFQKSLL